MVRPNIDISHAVNGQVRDYADKYGMDINEAYAEIIKAGLEARDD